MEQFPFAVDSDSSPIVASAGDDASSLVTASSQGSFVPTSEDDVMNSSSNQQIDDEDNVAVFANLTPDAHHAMLPPISTMTPPTPSLEFNATIVELPPPTNPELLHRPTLSVVSTPSTTSMGGGATATTTSLLSGVDALKSAGSRVTSVLSHFGYTLGNHTTSTTVKTGGTVAASTPLDTGNQHKNHNLDSIEAQPDEATIDFAYINVTDEDEVDIWLDESHSNTDRLENTSMNFGFPDSANGSHRADILAVLLASDFAPQATSEDENAPVLSKCEQLVELTEKANEATAKAGMARKYGNLQNALDRHSDAAKLFHQAALLIRDQDGTLFCSSFPWNHFYKDSFLRP